MRFLLLVIVLAVVIYLLVRLIERRRGHGHGGAGGGGGGAGGFAWPRRTPPRPSGPLGPDDDPEFLRDLNRRTRRRQKPDS